MTASTASKSYNDNKSIITSRSNKYPKVNSESGKKPGCTKSTGYHETPYKAYSKSVTSKDVDWDNEHMYGKLQPTGEPMLWHYRLGHIPFRGCRPWQRLVFYQGI